MYLDPWPLILGPDKWNIAMRKPGSTFSESWHKVAELQMRLKPTVETWKQFFRGEQWYILHDPFNNQFFRLRPAAYEFVSRLRFSRSVEDVWKECLQKYPDQAPGQEDVIQLLTQLYFSNLLSFASDIDSSGLFKRHKERRQQEMRSKLLSIMFLRIPLWDPDSFLNKIKPIINLVVSMAGAGIFVFAVVWAGKLAVANFGELTSQAQGMLAPENIVWLYVALVLLKSLHEMGHAFVCKRYNGEVHTMGVMFLIFTPLPYMDASSSWTFRQRWMRVLVGSAGILTEIFIAALAVLVWAHVGSGFLNSLAYNLIIIASVSTVIFNANPLLRFDGYYILSDLLDIPNLHQRSKDYLRYLLEKFVFGVKNLPSPTQSGKEAFWLCFFGVLSSLYRIVVFVGIALFVADKLFILGLLLALFCAIAWLVVPVFQFLRYLATSPSLAQNRPRAIGICVTVVLCIVVLLGFVPFPRAFRAPGVMQDQGHYRVLTEVSGYLTHIQTQPGMAVNNGTVLVKMSNPRLKFKNRRLLARKRELQAVLTQARKSDIANVSPVEEQLSTLQKELEKNRQRINNLTVRAQQKGRWIAPKLTERKGLWVQRGDQLGEMVNLDHFKFLAVISQTEAYNLFGKEFKNKGVKVRGEEKETLRVNGLEIIPFQQSRLPSAALSWKAGGEIRTKVRGEQSGLETTEPFFLMRCQLQSNLKVTRLHGRSGELRLGLPDQALWKRIVLSIRQLLQERFQL